EGVLLRLVEPMDLVDEEDGPPTAAAELRLRVVDDVPQILHALEDRGERDGVRPARGSEEMGEGGLAASGRTPEDQRLDLAALDHVAQHASRPEEMLLPDELVDRPRPHPLRERGARGTRRLGGCAREEFRLSRHDFSSSTRPFAWHRHDPRGRKSARRGVAMARIRTVGLVVKRDRPRAVRLAARMITWLRRRGLPVLVDAEAHLAGAPA